MQNQFKSFIYLSMIFIIMMSSMYMIGRNDGIIIGRVRQCNDMDGVLVQKVEINGSSNIECMPKEEFNKLNEPIQDLYLDYIIGGKK